MKIFSIAVALFAIILSSSCQQENAEKSPAPASDEITALNRAQKSDPDAGQNDKKNEAPGQEPKKAPAALTPIPKPDWDKKIVKNATVNIEVKDYGGYYSGLREKVRNLGGYVAQEEQDQSEYKIENTMVIRVPADHFDDALTSIASGALKINQRKISSEDVTSQLVDVKSRIEARKQVRSRYMDLLEKAKNMSEILNVQAEINSVQEDIESATGRAEYLAHASAFSTINLTYYQVTNASAKDREAGNASFGSRVKDALDAGWDMVSNVFIAILAIWPLLTAAILVFLLYRRLRSKKTAPPANTAE